MFGSTNTGASTTTKIEGLRVNSAVRGKCIPIVFGVNKVGVNVIDYDDFTATPNDSSVGKGGGGGATSYDYSASVILGLCEGEIEGIGGMQYGKLWYATPGAAGLDLFVGTVSQSPWSYFVSNHPTKALSYSGLAYLAGIDYPLGSGGSLENFQIEVYGLLRSFGYDCNPAHIVKALLTNTYYGAGFALTNVKSLQVYQDYCLAFLLLISPVYDSQRSCAEMIQEIAELTNSAFVWSQDQLDCIPYGDVSAGDYVAPSAPLYDLTVADFLDKDEPVKLSRTRQADTYNRITLECLDRWNWYTADPVYASNDSSIDLYGLRAADVKQGHIFAERAYASHAAYLMLQRQDIRNRYTCKLGWQHVVWDPMDILTITYAPLELNRQWVRVVSMGEDEDGQLTFEFEEYLQGSGAAAIYNIQSPDGYFADYGVDPGNCNDPVIFEPPKDWVSTPEIWITVSGGADWGGCDVYVSSDNTTYKKIGEIAGNSRQGLLSVPLAAGEVKDTVNTIAVDLTMSRGELLSGSLDDAVLYNTLCYVDGELIAYQMATLVATNKYYLGVMLIRGAYGTEIKAHPAGSQFARLDARVEKFPYDVQYVGKTLYFKFAGKNIYGGAVQDISQISAYPYAVLGTAYVPPDVTYDSVVSGSGQVQQGEVVIDDNGQIVQTGEDQAIVIITDLVDKSTTLSTFAENGKTFIEWTLIQDAKDFSYRVSLGETFDQAKTLGFYPSTVNRIEVTQNGTYWVTAFRVVRKDALDAYTYVESKNPASVSVNLNYLVAAAEIKANTLTLTWNLLKDAVITGYDLYGTTSSTDNWSLGTLLASVGARVSTYSWTWTAVCGYQRLWVVAKAGSASLYKAAYADVIHPTPVDTINVAFADPNIIVSWPAVSGASGYRIWILGGIGQVYTLTNTQITLPIAPYDMTLWVSVLFPDGRESVSVEATVDVSGIYQQNQVVNVAVDFASGTFVNMVSVSGAQLQRPSIKGGTVAAPYAASINDSDLWNFAGALDNIDAANFDNIDAGWFRDRWWDEDGAWYESPSVDLGAIVTGRLCGRLVTNVVDYTGDAANVDDLDASVFDGFTTDKVGSNRAVVTASFQVSSDGTAWSNANLYDWVTCRYVKFVAKILEASPLLDITITSGNIIIDVPDIIDSGQVTVTGGTTADVTFNKTFSKPPTTDPIDPGKSNGSIILTVIGNINAWPTNITVSGFTVNLSSNLGTTVVNWQAKGY